MSCCCDCNVCVYHAVVIVVFFVLCHAVVIVMFVPCHAIVIVMFVLCHAVVIAMCPGGQ